MFTTLTFTALLLPFLQNQKPTPEDLAFTAAQAEVALALYRELETESANLVVSPFSVVRAMAMAREGAAGTTAEELDRALLRTSDSNARFASLARLLEPRIVGDEDERHAVYTLELATSLWGQKGAPIAPDYLGRLKNGYASELFTVDFRRQDEARLAINAWTSQRTGGRIPEILPEGVPSSDTLLVLVDAIRFVGGWAHRFDPTQTSPAPFTTASGTKRDVSTMRIREQFPFGETALAHVLELPFERSAAGLVLILPKRADGLAELVEKESIAQWTGSLRPRSVGVELPKFRFDWGAELSTALRSLGVKAAFDPEHADFSRTTTSPFPLHITNVLHRAFLSVDELGAEAAAATAVLKSWGAERDDTPVTFRANHPFLFVLRHKATGAVLFLGRVGNPAG